MLLKSRNGFILLDLLLTLSVLLLFLSFILPSTLSLTKYQDQQNYYLIADELYNDLLKNQANTIEESVQKTIYYKDKEFNIQIKLINPNVLEYCIKWSHLSNHEESMCRYVPKQ